MGTFVRQLAVLSVLWAVCELLLPDGRQQQMVRMTVSVLVMAALLSTAGELLQVRPQYSPALAQQLTAGAENHYRKTALRAMANQAAAYCERFFSRAGCSVEASVFLHLDGTLERIEIECLADEGLISAKEAAGLLVRQLDIDAECLRLSVTGAEME